METIIEQNELNFLTEISQSEILEMRIQESQNILNSYNSEYDVFCELAQNAIDAIDENNNILIGNLVITYNQYEESLTFEDNGTGIPLALQQKVFAPNIGFKKGNKLRGEKGVGLTFLVYSTNHFEYETSDGETVSSGYIKNAYNWVNNPSQYSIPKIINLETRIDNKKQSYTRFKLQGIHNQNEINIFNYSSTELEYILRTKTAIGNTNSLFNKKVSKNVKITLRIIDNENNLTEERDINYSFPVPHHYVENSISWEEREKYIKDNKKSFVFGKPIFEFGETKTKQGKPIKYYIFCAGAYVYDSIREKIFGPTDTKVKKEFHKSLFPSPKIELATRNMPSVIKIPNPVNIKPAYFQYNYFIILEYDEVKFDWARKFITGPISKMLTDNTGQLCIKSYKWIQDIIANENESNIDRFNAEDEIEDTWEKLASINNLSISNLGYKKEAISEQDVICIFHELIGKGFLKNYSIWHTSQNKIYDSYIKFPHPNKEKADQGREKSGIVEFKLLLNDIIPEIKTENTKKTTKHYSQINLIVCWDIDNNKNLNDSGLVIEEMRSESIFYGATHKLSCDGINNPIEVLSLKYFIENIKL